MHVAETNRILRKWRWLRFVSVSHYGIAMSYPPNEFEYAMEDSVIATATKIKEPFHEPSFEKRLLQLKDTQDSIQALSNWCVQNRAYVENIVRVWYKVIKKVKVELRLTLFYLANDVLQYCRKKNLNDFVEGWMWALKEATPLVRDEKVKKRVQRIFKIWDERDVYTDVFVLELLTLLDNVSKADTTESAKIVSEFDSNNLIERIKKCKGLEDETDSRQRRLNEAHLKITDVEALRSNLKDRKKTDDFLPELDESVKRMEAYVEALDCETSERMCLISVLEQSEIYYDIQRGEAKVVATAYKNFGHRVKTLKKKLDELLTTLSSSPAPSPDLNAPSPPPDYELDAFVNRNELKQASLLGVGRNVKTDLDSRLSMLFNGSFLPPGVGIASSVGLLPLGPSNTEVLADAQASMAELLRTLSASLVQQAATPGLLPYSLLVPPPPPPPLPFPETIPPPPPTTSVSTHNWLPPPAPPAPPPRSSSTARPTIGNFPWNNSVSDLYRGYISFEDSDTLELVRAGNSRLETSVDHRNLISLTGNQSPASQPPASRQTSTAKPPRKEACSSQSHPPTVIIDLEAKKKTNIKLHYPVEKSHGAELSTSSKRKWDETKSRDRATTHHSQSGNSSRHRDQKDQKRRSKSSPQRNGHYTMSSSDRDINAEVSCLLDKFDEEWVSHRTETTGKKPIIVEKKPVTAAHPPKGPVLQSAVVVPPAAKSLLTSQRHRTAPNENPVTSVSHSGSLAADIELQSSSAGRRLSRPHFDAPYQPPARRPDHSTGHGQQSSRSHTNFNGPRVSDLDAGRPNVPPRGRSEQTPRFGGRR